MSKPFFSIIFSSSDKDNYKNIYNSLDLSLCCSKMEDIRAKKVKSFKKRKNLSKADKREITRKIVLPHSRLLDIPFEMICVGNNFPVEVMPDNFRYIYSDEEIEKCINIGVENSNADYILLVNETMRYSDLFLDTLYMFVSRILPYMKKVLIMPMYSLNGVLRDDLMRLDINDFFSPIIGKSCVFDKNIWMELGGLDRGGIADLQIKFYKQGYSPFIATISVVEEITSE